MSEDGSERSPELGELGELGVSHLQQRTQRPPLLPTTFPKNRIGLTLPSPCSFPQVCWGSLKSSRVSLPP